MEVEIIVFEEDEIFDSYMISQLIDSDFGRKPQKSRVFIPASPTGPPPAATSPTSGRSAPALANTPIYPTHTSGTGPIPGVYMQSPSIKFLLVAHTPPSTGPTPATYM